MVVNISRKSVGQVSCRRGWASAVAGLFDGENGMAEHRRPGRLGRECTEREKEREREGERERERIRVWA